MKFISIYWYLYAEILNEVKYEFLIIKHKDFGIKHFTDSEVFIEYLNNMDHIVKIIEKYNPSKKCKILTVFDDMIADMLSNKNFIQ